MHHIANPLLCVRSLQLVKYWQQEFATRALVTNKMPDPSNWDTQLSPLRATVAA